MILIDELDNWYWTHGVRRSGKYELKPETWLDRLYRAERNLRAVRSGRASRKSMAFWGTSQTGKSTLLSSYLDESGDPEGERSALTWAGGPNVRFCIERRTEPPPDSTVILNPRNFNSDASSCISRFRIADVVDDPAHPIEIRLASPAQVMHALAMGYATECRRDRGESKAVSYDIETLAGELDRFAERRAAAGSGSRESYRRLHELADLVDLLVLSGHDRFEPLSLVEDKGAARRRILACHAFLKEPADIEALAFRLLWDDQEPLNDVYRRLVGWTEARRTDWGDRRVFGSPQAVASLLDASSYTRLHSKEQDVRGKAVDEARRLRVDVQTDRVVIGAAAGAALFQDPEEYGLFQGNVLELVIPVRREAMADHPDLVRFLDEADLLDFPGTGRAHANQETALDLGTLKADDRPQLFTRVLKRGKTASIVAAYARDLSIDGFSVLAKVMDNPGQPQQLLTGIKSWTKAFTGKADVSPSPLPLNLVMSFWGKFFREMNDEQIKARGIKEVFDTLQPLGQLARPESIWQTLAVNYPNLDEPDAQLPKPGPALDATVQATMTREDFKKQFAKPESRDSFREMVANGGTDHLFRVIRSQAGDSPRASLLGAMEREGNELLSALIAEALPTPDDTEKSRQALRTWADRLEGMLASKQEAEAAEEASLVLRTLLGVPTESLEPIPTRLRDDRGGKATAYVQTQFLLWAEHAKAEAEKGRDAIGLADADHARHAIYGLMEAVDQRHVVSWLVETLGDIQSRSQGRSSLRYLAIRMSNELLPGARDRPHRSHDAIVEAMNVYEDRDRYLSPSYKDSPHYLAVLAPFIVRLRKLGESLRPGGRQPQPGDDELKAIQDRAQAV